MRRGRGTNAVSLWRSCFIAVSMPAVCTPVRAHHQPPHDGATVGVAMSAITHGEMPVVARYRASFRSKPRALDQTD
jgi:hypothetical protein